MSKRRTKNMFWESAMMNTAEYIQYYNRLLELAVSMFEWKGLPDTVDKRFLELTLFAKGRALFFEDKDMGCYLALPCTLGGRLNVYNIPLQRRAYASNGYNNNFTETDSVIIYNNYLHTNSKLDCEVFSKRLYNLDRAVDVNANAQKTPILIQCKDTERLTMENLYKQYEGNEPFIFGTDKLDTTGLKVLQTGAPYVADRLYELRTLIWNEALTYLGINSVNTIKKERLITDEVASQQGGTIASRYSRLESRRQACEQINQMFGLNVSVDYREGFNRLIEQELEQELENEERKGEEE